MRHYRMTLGIWVSLLLLSACGSSPTPAAATFKAVPLKGDPRMTLSTANDMLLVDIASPTGIGSARIEKTAGHWPPKVVLRLRVTGLEEFKFQYGDTTITLSVSGQANHAVREEVEQSGQTSTLSAGDPNWIAVTLAAGYFDLEVPAAFLKSGENQFMIEWIDFYR